MTNEQFWARVAKRENGCWEFQGAGNRKGYVTIYLGGGAKNPIRTMAHRHAYILSTAPIPKGVWVLHRCDNPPCCNPDHLYLGDAKQNNKDTRDRGRFNNQNSIKTHCKNGHEFTPENTWTYQSKRGPQRYCRTCRGELTLKWHRDYFAKNGFWYSSRFDRKNIPPTETR